MRALIQRVQHATVEVAEENVGNITAGLLILLGVGQEDDEACADFLAQKISKLRIFNDASGKMNRSILDVGGAALVVSQFTLFADCSSGNRPSYSSAARPDKAIPLYEYFMRQLEALGISVSSGRFGANMQVSLLNDGPVTLWLDTDSLMKRSA